MKAQALTFLTIIGVLCLALLCAAMAQSVDALTPPTAAEIAQDYAKAQQIEQNAQIEATWAPIRAAALNLFFIVAGLLLLAYLASLALIHVRNTSVYARPTPAGLLPVERQDQHTARAALASHFQVRAIEAARQPVPQHYAPHISYTHELEYKGEHAALPAEAAAAGATSTPGFGELLTAGRIGPGQPILLGHDLETGEGVWGSWKDLYSAGLGGKQGSGKSWTAASLIAQSLLSGARVVLCDPHAGDEESLTTRLEPLMGAMELVADDDRDILEAARYAHDEFKQRRELAKAKKPYDQTPLILVIDEWTALLRGDVGDELPPLLAALTTEGRKYGVNALLLAQRWEAAAAGGSDVRNTLTAHYVHRMRGDEARMMTGLRASVLPDDTLSLQPGQAYLFDTKGNIRKVATPLMTPADLARVASLLVGAPAPSEPPAQRPNMGFRAPNREGAAEGVSEGAKTTPLRGHQNAANLTPEEARILAGFLAGKSPSDLAAELNDGKASGDGYIRAARKVADALRKALGARGGGHA